MRVVLPLLILAAPAAADPVKLGGYVEVYDAWNFNDPANSTTALRGFDARHATFSLQNAVVDVTWDTGVTTGRIALQIGDAGSIYYGHETDWRNVQEAWAAWKTHDVQVAAGLFLSPIGVEDLAVKDDWSWSRSNLFYALPFYHVGVRATVPLTKDGWSAMGMICNGWNNVVDNNHEPSLTAAVTYERAPWYAQLLYFGGIERDPGAPEGSPWRHLGDAYIQAPLGHGFSALAHVDAGTERGSLGADSWIAGAAAARYDLTSHVFASARIDGIREYHAQAASPVLVPVAWVTSDTLTLAWRPVDHLMLMLEGRHDDASGKVFFGDADLPTRRTQTTITAGATAWF
jgi:hypothetical protein